MKRLVSAAVRIFAVLLIPAGTGAGPLGPVSSVSHDGQTVRFEMENGTMELVVCAPNIIRCRAIQGDSFPDKNSYSVVAPVIENAGYSVEDSTGRVLIVTDALAVSVAKSSGDITYRDLQQNVILAESGNGKTVNPATRYPEAPCAFSTSFVVTAGEQIYGLGQYPFDNGAIGWKGRNQTLYPQVYTSDGNWMCIPLALSSRGWGLFWDSFVSRISWPGGSTLKMDADNAVFLDYYFIYGPEPDSVIKSYRHLTGAPPLFGRWAYGYHQSKNRYRSQAEVLGILDGFRSRNIPIDMIVVDWMYWGNAPWGSHDFDPAQWPDPAGMNAEIHEKNCHSIVSVWTCFAPGSDNYIELNNAGCLGPTSGWPPGARYYNPFNESCSEIYWRQIKEQILPLGFNSIWHDATEGDMYADIDWRSPAYAIQVNKSTYEGQRAITDERRVYTLTRSAWAGQQRYATAVWSGDIQSDFAALRRQIPAGLNFCMTGIPYWATDIGGYWEGTGLWRSDVETYTRWFEYGTFCPVFRAHGSEADKEPWRFPSSENIIKDYIKLRYRLLPYIYSVAWMVTSEGYTMMRGLVMDFSADEGARSVSDQFMFGPALLVNPVTTAGASSRQVYLPQSDWYDFWTGAPVDGGATISAAAPLEKIPLFVRAGSILPLGPLMQFATEAPADPIELRVYTGADGAFGLYEDENENYGYENGEYAQIPFEWNETAQELTIGSRRGEFTGMLDSRTFNVVWVDEGHGAGGQPEQAPDVEVTYDGTGLRITRDGEITGASEKPRPSCLTNGARIRGAHIRIVAGSKQAWTVRVYDLRGRTACRASGTGTGTVAAGGLPKGVYAVSADFGHGALVRHKMTVR